MKHAIDSTRLKEVAEHLEWVLRQYPDEPEVQGLLHALRPLLDAAKAMAITETIDSTDVPGAYNFGDGRYRPFEDPSVDSAYVDFRVALRGGPSARERQLIAKMARLRVARLGGEE